MREAVKSKADVGFGAVLVKNGRIIGRGWNRLSTFRERAMLTHVDYAIHAEQACVFDAMQKLIPLHGSRIYVLGIVRTGPQKGKLTTRRQKIFVCRDCPPSVLLRFNIPVYIPHVKGWTRLSPEKAMETAKKFHKNGYWKKIAT